MVDSSVLDGLSNQDEVKDYTGRLFWKSSLKLEGQNEVKYILLVGIDPLVEMSKVFNYTIESGKNFNQNGNNLSIVIDNDFAIRNSLIKGEILNLSGLNDGFDFSTLSRWPDGRKAIERALDSDLRGVLDAYAYHLDTLTQIAPKALILALVGNHDVRLLNGNKGTEDYLQLEVMQRLAKHGLVFLRDFSRENIIKITDNLIWFHGTHARKKGSGARSRNIPQSHCSQ